MKLWRKGFGTTLSVIVLTSLIVGCSKSADSSTASGSPTGASPAATNAAPKYPTEMTYFALMDGDAAVSLKSYGEMAVYKQMEKITGTKVTFQHPASSGDAARQQLDLMLASGTLPDVIYYSWKGKTPDKFIKEGKILRLNEIIEKYAPNLSKWMKDNPDLKKQMTSEDGNIYVFPYTSASLYAYHGVMVRQDWLTKLNLKPPVTIDDWEKVLIAFRDQDPNGNGKKDEVPYFYRKEDYNSSSPFLGAFGILANWYQENNVVKFGPMQPKFRDYLTLMNKWYMAGLINKDYLTDDTKIRSNKMQNDQIGALAGWAASDLGASIQLQKDKNPNTSFNLLGVPFPVLKVGDVAVSAGAPKANWGGYGAAISTSAKNPEQIAAWLDYAYSKEGSRLFNWGIEGQSYTMVNGKPQFTDNVLKADKLSVTQALSKYALAAIGGPFDEDPEADMAYHNDLPVREAMLTWNKADHSKFLYGSLTTDEQAKVSAIMTDLNTYNEEMINKFIMGKEPLSNFDDYQKTLTKLKIDEAAKIYQAALDRYLKQQ